MSSRSDDQGVASGARRPRWRAGVVALLLLSIAAPVLAEDTVVLVPQDRADWRLGNLFAWLRASHNYGKRSIEVETSPADATLDLFYIRSNFQKRYEQAEAPVRVLLPSRVDAGPRDSVMIRAFREGYRQKEVSIRVQSDQDRVLIELAPLPNKLMAVSHVYLAGRGSLTFLTKEALTVRVQDRDDGFNVILAETARSDDVEASLEGISSPLVKKVSSLQLGEDLLVRVDTQDGVKGRYQLRARQSRDELRDLYVYSVEMVPADGGIEAVQRARSALSEIGPADVSGCAVDFDRTLRDELDPTALSRALSPRGAFVDPYLRAAMKRLGEVSPGGRIAMLDGSSYQPASTLELSAAMSQPADARGFLAFLRAFVARLETPDHRRETLRGLIAPESSPRKFDVALAVADAAEQQCRAGASAPAAR